MRESKIVKFKIIKKNRKYFKCNFSNGGNFDLFIDEFSENLPLNELMEIELEDHSITSKYGTKLIYKVKSGAEKLDFSNMDDCYIIKSQIYNIKFIERARELGGKWQKEDSLWIFPPQSSDLAEELDIEFENYSLCEIHFRKEYSKRCDLVIIGGMPIAEAYSRDSGAKFKKFVTLLSGNCDSGGSHKNWATCINKGTKIRVPLPTSMLPNLIEIYADKDVEITEISKFTEKDLAFFNEK